MTRRITLTRETVIKDVTTSGVRCQVDARSDGRLDWIATRECPPFGETGSPIGLAAALIGLRAAVRRSNQSRPIQAAIPGATA